MSPKKSATAIISALMVLGAFQVNAVTTSPRAEEMIARINERIAQMRARIFMPVIPARPPSTPTVPTNPPATPIPSPVTPPQTAGLTKAKVIELTNVQRQNAGLSRLVENEKLSRAALAKANDMLQKQYFAHVAPDGTGLKELVASVGYNYWSVAENLAYGNFKDDSQLVSGWMNSPGHRANILNGKFTEIGVAVVKGTYQGRSVWMAVQEFGLPRN